MGKYPTNKYIRFISEYYYEFRELPYEIVDLDHIKEWVERYNKYSAPLGRIIDISGLKVEGLTSDVLIPNKRRKELEFMRRQARLSNSIELHKKVDKLYLEEGYRLINNRKNY